LAGRTRRRSLTEEPHWTAGRQLVHYTDTVKKVVSILENGVLLVPNKRLLISRFLDPELFKDREPQEFGMACFTEVGLADLRKHREDFGGFGIGVTWDWALSNGAQRVIYISDDGPVFETFGWLFKLGKQEFDQRSTDRAGMDMALKNKAMASVGRAFLYARLLSLYEYMEPEKNSSQVEWRIVNKIPLYQDGANQEEIVAKLLEMVRTWKIGAVPLNPGDVMMILCPQDRAAELREALPARFKDVTVEPYSEGSNTPPPPRPARTEKPKEISTQPETVKTPLASEPRKKSRGVAPLPDVGRIQGMALYHDDVISESYCSLQYTDRTGNWLEVKIPLLDTLYLLNILREIEKRPGIAELNRPPDVRP
jgi:hypothetical protein